MQEQLPSDFRHPAEPVPKESAGGQASKSAGFFKKIASKLLIFNPA